MSRYRFIVANRACYPIALLCRVLGVARSGYQAWLTRPESARQQANLGLTERIRVVYAASRQTDGSPRVHAVLRQHGVCCSRKRVARLMRQARLVGCRLRRRTRTTRAEPTHQPAPNLVARQFTVEQRDQLWVGDITYIPTWEGWLYLAVLLDAGAPPGSASGGRLGDGRASGRGVDARRPRHGTGPASPDSRTAPSLGSGQPVHGQRLSGAPR